MSIRNQITSGLKWQGISTVGRNLISFVVFTTLARLLEPSDFGLMGLTYVYSTLAAMLTEQGIRTALIQRQQLDASHLNTAFCFLGGLAVIISVITIVFSNQLASIFGNARLAPILSISSIGLIIKSTTAIHETIFSRDLEFRIPALRSLVGTFAGGLIGIGMALLGFGVWSLVGQQLGGTLIDSIFLWYASKYRPSFRFSMRSFRELIGVSSSVFVNSLLWFFTSRIDQILIGRVAGVTQLGHYMVAYKLPDFLRTATQQPLEQVLLPAFSRLQHDRERMLQTVYSGMRLNATITFAFFGGLAATASDIVPILFGPKWGAASDLCALLSINSLIFSLQVFGYPVMVASGLAGTSMILGFLYAVGVTAACLIGIQFGAPFVILGLITNSLLQLALVLCTLHRRIGLEIRTYFQCFAAPACAALIMAGAIQLLSVAFSAEPGSWARFCWSIAVGAPAYLASLHFFDRKILWDIFCLARDTLPITKAGRVLA